MPKGILRYDAVNDRWYFDKGNSGFGIHCGETMAIKIEDQYLLGRVEMDIQGNWYCIFEEAAFTLRRGYEYSAKID